MEFICASGIAQDGKKYTECDFMSYEQDDFYLMDDWMHSLLGFCDTMKLFYMECSSLL
jgi:hypothetical protein